jgi:hypothetical protein
MIDSAKVEKLCGCVDQHGPPMRRISDKTMEIAQRALRIADMFELRMRPVGAPQQALGSESG